MIVEFSKLAENCIFENSLTIVSVYSILVRLLPTKKSLCGFRLILTKTIEILNLLITITLELDKFLDKLIPDKIKNGEVSTHTDSSVTDNH